MIMLGGLTLFACGRFQSFSTVSLRPTVEPELFNHRQLDDIKLGKLLTAQGAARPKGEWTPRQLALAALYFHPSLREADADVEVARAAELSAGISPGVSASAEIGRASRADEGKSTPWSVTLTSGLTFETGGKRAARRARARALTLESVLRLQAAAWQLGLAAEKSATRAAGAERELLDAEGEQRALRELVVLIRARYTEGRVSLADVAQAEQEARIAMLAVAQVVRQRTESRLELARALATPLRAVDSLSITAPNSASCDGTKELRFDSLGGIALHERADVGAAMAAYAAAEAGLRLEVARQYPDLTIGPGIAWDQGVLRWLIALGTPGIAQGLNRGPIAEARALRAVEGARFALLQDSVLTAVDSAVAVCRDAMREIAASGDLVAATEQSLRLAESAFQRGETGLTEVAFARLALLRATRSAHIAAQRAREADITLESAGGIWPEGGVRWPDLETMLAIPHRQ